MIKKKLSLFIILFVSCTVSMCKLSAQELTARFDFGVSDILYHSQGSFDYYLNKKYGVNLGLDFGSGTLINYYSTGYPNYNTYSYTSDLRYTQFKVGGVRRFFVGRSFIEPVIGLAYCFGPRNLRVGGEKESNNGVLISNGIELQIATEYNITKKLAVRFQYSINNTDYVSSMGLRYSFFYKDK
jgi:hypothetical protein